MLKTMGYTVEKIFKLVLLLSYLSSVAGKPKPKCSQVSEIERYDPSDTGAVVDCVKCPECPEGLGLSPQCGTRVPNDTRIECKPCVANITYSDSHDIRSCKSCPECGLKDVIQHCTPTQKRICGTKCPQGYFLDHNHICQECYFCCDNVPESGRRQGCKEIGMDRNWQCEKTEQNQRCKEALDKATSKPTDSKPATMIPHHYNQTMSTMTLTKKDLKTQVHETNLSKISPVGGSTTMGSSPGTRGMVILPGNDDSTTKEQKTGQEEHIPLTVVIGVVVIISIIGALALLTSKRAKKFCKFSRKKQEELADSTELLPLPSNCEPTDSGRTSPQDLPNQEKIPAGCRVSEMEQLRDDQGTLMLFYVQNKLDVLRTSSRKNWYDVGLALDVSSDDLDLIETDYMARASPTKSLLSKLENRAKEPTMKDFVQALIICERHDVANIICNWPWENYFFPLGSDSSTPERVLQAAEDNAIIEVG